MLVLLRHDADDRSARSQRLAREWTLQITRGICSLLKKDISWLRKNQPLVATTISAIGSRTVQLCQEAFVCLQPETNARSS
ncbi:hypothetical protein WK33_04885 [Burkholderia multivorans]|nr:hypothetical protein WK33_04885 [Burkholderia multivorans]